MKRLIDYLVALSKRTPYFDIYDDFGSGDMYMGRDWLMPRWTLCRDEKEGFLKPKPWMPFSLRLHHIKRADLDRSFHDHPASFFSLVLRGGYVERRPTSTEPCWRMTDRGQWEEDGYDTFRLPGSIAFRSYSHRHRITHVQDGTLTLVLWFRKRQSWGFWTAAGKIHWKSYSSAHNSAVREAA